MFEGDLAHIASSHLKKDDHVHIAGQLTADSPAIEGQANVQVKDFRLLSRKKLNYDHVISLLWMSISFYVSERYLLNNLILEEPLSESLTNASLMVVNLRNFNIRILDFHTSRFCHKLAASSLRIFKLIFAVDD